MALYLTDRPVAQTERMAGIYSEVSVLSFNVSSLLLYVHRDRMDGTM